MLHILFYLGVVILKFHLSEAKVCRALALRGGGVKGAYEVGVLKAFSEHLNPEDIHYDVVSGVSIGSMNGAIFALFEKGQEKEAIAYLEELWENLATGDMWKNWGYGFLEGFFKESFLDSSPGLNTVRKMANGRTFKRKVGF